LVVLVKTRDWRSPWANRIAGFGLGILMTNVFVNGAAFLALPDYLRESGLVEDPRTVYGYLAIAGNLADAGALCLLLFAVVKR
jgi:hypothetical protein